MRVLLVYPGALTYSKVYLRLEPLGLERIAGALRRAGHEVRLIDLQVYRPRAYWRLVWAWRPQAIGFCLNYLANVPEVLDLAQETKRGAPGTFIFAGGHSVSFIAEELLEQSEGGIDAVVRGEGEEITPRLVETCADGAAAVANLPGVVTAEGSGPAPRLLEQLDEPLPARDLGGRRRRYFIGHLDPCASVELTRGCPWDCAFCSAWTFYGRSYRKLSAEAVVRDLRSVREPNVFIVDDVAFIHAEHGYEIGRAIERAGIGKEYYLETRCDVLNRHPEVFEYWARLGLRYMFLGIEAIDDDALKAFRKRSDTHQNARALELARRLGIRVAINLIADASWSHEQFERARQFAYSVPEIVHLTVATPYPGTELWHTETRKLATRDYRLFDMQHAVLPTKLPLADFYRELVATQAVLARKHMGWAALRGASWIALKLLARGQTNFVRSLWKFSSVYDARRQLADHQLPVKYEIAARPTGVQAGVEKPELYVHEPAGLAALGMNR